jgi:hypothetical protein
MRPQPVRRSRIVREMRPRARALTVRDPLILSLHPIPLPTWGTFHVKQARPAARLSPAPRAQGHSRRDGKDGSGLSAAASASLPLAHRAALSPRTHTASRWAESDRPPDAAARPISGRTARGRALTASPLLTLLLRLDTGRRAGHACPLQEPSQRPPQPMVVDLCRRAAGDDHHVPATRRTL